MTTTTEASSTPTLTPGRVGHRIMPSWRRPPAETLEVFRPLSVPSVSDAQLGHGVLDAGLSILVPPRTSPVGAALPVTITPGNGMMIRRAIELAEPGDVLMVNGHGTSERAVLGGNVLMSAAAAGIVAVIVDGAVRDLDDAERLGVGLVARAVSPRSGTDQLGAGEVGSVAAVGGVAVAAGDVVVIDQDGVVVVPAGDAADVSARAAEVQRRKGSADNFDERWAGARAARQNRPAQGS
ncbi:RraA family protein [Actinophytocola sp.]|uniref:RraA family protein n=1 Tax=Actinophytocola sp. TaxID=1872138 RepID=UPI003D6A6ADA